MPTERQFEHEDIAKVPRGWKVRTITQRGGTRVRVAFPPGRRVKGSGKLISILYPKNAKRNQIVEALSGAAAIKSLLPAKKGKGNPKTKTREQVEAMQAKAVRFLEDVVGDDDKAGEIERMSPEEYAAKKKIQIQNPSIASGWNNASERYRALVLREAKVSNAEQLAKSQWEDLPVDVRRAVSGKPRENKFDTARERAAYAAGLARGGASLRSAGEALRRKRATRLERMMRSGLGRNNPDEAAEAARLYAEFHGKRPDQVQELQERDITRDTYTALGDLLELKFNRDGDKYKLDFQDCRVKLASSANGQQLYLIGGDQNCDELLQNGHKDFVNLGVIDSVVYVTRKGFDNFKENAYQHKFGEEGGEKPWGLYNTLSKRIFIVDGSYRVEKASPSLGMSPGIVD